MSKRKNMTKRKSLLKSSKWNSGKKLELSLLIVVFLLCSQFIRAQEKTTTTSTNVKITSAEVKQVPPTNSHLRVLPLICEYKLLNNEKADSISIDTKVSVKSIVNNANTWIENFVYVAESKLMKKYDADAILSATRDAYTSNEGTLVVVVRGYPVKYKNFHTATPEDVELLKGYDKGTTPIIDMQNKQQHSGKLTSEKEIEENK